MKFSMTVVVLALLLSGAPAPASADVSRFIVIAPPDLPVYEQPMLPGDGYIWTPGYWAYDEDNYYWVPGTWVRPPRVGYLWTPGYWFWDDNYFVFRSGYWGRSVGYYGGVNYGYGYGGFGYDGGRWDHDRFHYNRAVNNINVTNIRNTYNTTVINDVTVSRISYNGGHGGTNALPRDEERASEREEHVATTHEQVQHEGSARARRELRQSADRGRPPIAAAPMPVVFEDRGVRESPAAASLAEPGRNTAGADARTNARAIGNSRRERRQQDAQPVKGAEPMQHREQPNQRAHEQRQRQQEQQQPNDPRPEQQQPARPQQAPQQQERHQRRQRPSPASLRPGQ